MTTLSEQAVLIIYQSEVKITLNPGEYTKSRLIELGFQEAAISSLKIAKGFQAIVYAGDSFTGDSMVIDEMTRLDTLHLKNKPTRLPFHSIRVIAAVIPEPEERDRLAVEQAIAGWWPASLINKEERISWWREARYGCFIHWGPYSVTGGRWKGEPSRGYAEHLMRAQKISLDEYKKECIEKFNPQQFDAEAWVQLFKAAGMRYVVITAKHHDGFAIYPSDAYPFDIRMTPFERDPLQELKEACKRHGLRFGFYYSHAFDWEHPDATGNDWEYTNPGGDLRLYEGKGKLWFNEHPELVPRVADYYVDQKSIPQIVELINKYEPDILWFDTPHKLPLSENLKILQAIREADDRIVVNGRLAHGYGFDTFSDYVNTADRALEIFPCEGDWETIPTTNESYGYSADDHSHKPADVFVQLLAKSSARGGNVLMNLGPMGDGLIDERDRTILQGIGSWLAVNGESIYGTHKTPLAVQSWGESTMRGNQLFLHVFDWPKDGKLVLGGLKSHIKKAWLLDDEAAQPLAAKRLNYYDWEIHVPEQAPNKYHRVVVIDVDGEPAVHPGRLISSSQTTTLRAFDAEVSKGIGYGDGKKGNDFVCKWTSIHQFIKWRVRLNHQGVYKLVIRMSAPGPSYGGSYALCLGEQRLPGQLVPSETAAPFLIEHEVTLASGEHDFVMMPVTIEGNELMRLHTITFIPLSTDQEQKESFDEVDSTDVGN